MGVEAYIEQRVSSLALAELGVDSVKMGQDGWPDRVFLIPWLPLFIEFKRPGAGLMPRQVERLQYLRSTGYWAEVHDTVAGAMQTIRLAYKLAKDHGQQSSFLRAAGIVDSTPLPKAGHEVLDRTRGRRAAVRSRSGQDVDYSGRIKGADEARVGAKNSNHRPASRVPISVARGARQMERLQRPKN